MAALERVTGVHDKTIPGEKRVAAVGFIKDQVSYGNQEPKTLSPM
jgi:hypothetical protein